jgi:hypothetical protein
LDCWTFEDGTEVVLKHQYGIAILHCIKSQKSADLVYVAAKA